MADFDSKLPVQTLSPGDVQAKIVDGTTPSQALAIDASGRITILLQDGAGNPITSQTQAAQQVLDVGINVGGVQIDPRDTRALTSADVVTANQGAANTAANGWPVKPTDGTNSQVFTALGEAQVSVTQPLPAGTNVIGKVSQDTSPWVVKDQADGPVAPGTVASFSQLAGGQYNASLPTLTDGQQAALQVDASGRVIIAPLTNSSIVKAQLQDNAGTGITLGQKAMASSVPVVIASDQAPIPVVLASSLPGTEVNDYNTASAVAAGSSSNHDYTITSTKTFKGKKIWASASGKMKIEVQLSPDGSAFTTKWVGFNSSAEPNITIDLDQLTFTDTGAGSKIRVIRTNRDGTAQDLYSTISGNEI